MQLIRRILNKLERKELFVFCGAGVSLSSGIPTVGQIDESGAVQDGIQTYLMRELGFSTDEMKKFLGIIPFEAFLQVLLDNHLPLTTFASIFQAEPTYIHHLMAQLFRRGILSLIGTTNLDMCFESAMNMVGVFYAPVRGPEDLGRFGEPQESYNTVFKLHGSVDQLEDMGITIRSIAQKKNLDTRKKIADAFFSGTPTTDTILVFGYSCSDVFDLVKWVPHIPRKLNVIYINHCAGNSGTNAVGSEDNARPRRMFSGHNLDIVNCDTDILVRKIGSHIGFRCTTERSPENYWRMTLKDCIRDFTGFTLAKVRGNLYYLCQEYNKSLLSHQEALSLANSGMQRLVASRNIGFSYYRLNRVDEAMFFMKQTYPLARKLGEHGHEANILMNIAACYADRGQYELSLECYMDALSISENSGLLREQCFILGNVGLMYAYAGRCEESLKYTMQGISLAHQLGEVETEGKFYANVGEAYLNDGKYQKAIEATRIAIDIAKDIGDSHGEINRRTNLLIAELRGGTLDIKRCHEQANVLLQQSLDCGNDLYAANCHQLIGDCHLADGDITSAIAAWKTAKLIYDEISPSKGKDVLRKISQHKVQ